MILQFRAQTHCEKAQIFRPFSLCSNRRQVFIVTAQINDSAKDKLLIAIWTLNHLSHRGSSTGTLNRYGTLKRHIRESDARLIPSSLMMDPWCRRFTVEDGLFRWLPGAFTLQIQNGSIWL